MPAFPSPELLHPALWRASQLAQGRGCVLDTGYSALSAELPGGGWPLGALVDLLVPHAGVGELRLLQPALATLGRRPVVFVQPPHLPNAAGLQHIGVPLDQVLNLRVDRTADALWSTEQILLAGTCGALLVWMPYVKPSSQRRLHVAAHSAQTLFFMIRPLAAARDASPAALRLALRPTQDGLAVDIVKRRGPPLAEPLSIPLAHACPVVSSCAPISPSTPLACRSRSSDHGGSRRLNTASWC
jgi:hypothetical protein